MAEAALGYDSGVQRSIANLYRRLRATRGFVPPGAEHEAHRGALSAKYGPWLRMVEAGEDRKVREDALELSKAQFAFGKGESIQNRAEREEARKVADRAATISGVTDIGTTAALVEYATKGEKGGGWISKGARAVWPGGGETTPAVTPTTPAVSGAPVVEGAQASVAPAVAGPVVAGPTTYAAGSEAAAAMAGTQTVGVGAGGEGTLTTVAGTGEVGAGAYAAPAAAGYMAGKYIGKSGTGKDVGEFLMGQHGGEQEHAAVTGGLTGAAAGAAIGTFVMPGIGTGAGAIIGAVAGAIGGGCIIFRHFYGLHSRQERYAKTYCARHMDPQTYLGYIEAGSKVIDMCKMYPETKNMVESLLVKPFHEYMLYKLKGKKIPYWKKKVARLLLRWFKWEGRQIQYPVLLHRNYAACYQNAGTGVQNG